MQTERGASTRPLFSFCGLKRDELAYCGSPHTLPAVGTSPSTSDTLMTRSTVVIWNLCTPEKYTCPTVLVARTEAAQSPGGSWMTLRSDWAICALLPTQP